MSRGFARFDEVLRSPLLTLILTVLFWGLSLTAAASTKPTQPVSREELFRTSRQILPSILESFARYEPEALKLAQILRTTYDPLASFLSHDAYPVSSSHWQGGIPLLFTDSQGNFQIREGEPIRTASTYASHPRDPISINTRIINDPRQRLDLMQALQLLLHENFHYIGPRDQTRVDALIARMMKQIAAHYREIDLPGGERLMILSWPVENSKGEAYRPLIDSGFVILKENSQGIESWTEKVGEILVREKLLHLAGTPAAGRLSLVSREFLWSGETVTLEKGGVQIRAHIARKDRSVLSSNYGPQDPFLSNTKSVSADFTLNLELRIGGDQSFEISKTSLEKTYRKVEMGLGFDLKIESETERELLIRADFDREILTSEEARLMVRAGGVDLEIAPEGTGGGRSLLFRLTRPQNSEAAELTTNSVVLQGNRIHFGRKGVRASLPARPPRAQSVRLQSMELLTPFGWRNDQRSPRVEIGEGLLRLTILSRTGLSEIRLRLASVLRTLSNPSDAHFPPPQPHMTGILYPGMGAQWDFRTEIEDVVLDSSKFRQTREGPNLIVEIPLNHAIKPAILEPIGTVTFRHSRFFTERREFSRYVGGDTGERTLQDLTLIGDDLARWSLEGRLNFSIETIPAAKRWVPTGAPSAPMTRENIRYEIPRCRKLFTPPGPQWLPPGQYKTREEIMMERARAFANSSH